MQVWQGDSTASKNTAAKERKTRGWQFGVQQVVNVVSISGGTIIGFWIVGRQGRQGRLELIWAGIVVLLCLCLLLERRNGMKE